MAKKRNPYEQAAWKSTSPGKTETGNQKLLPYKMMPENAIRYLKSQVLIKRSSSGIHIHIMKKVVTLQNDRILKSNVGAKNPCFL